MFMCRYCNTITMNNASEGMCRECVWVSKWAAQLKTILVAKWEVPVSKPERLPKRVVTYAVKNSYTTFRSGIECTFNPDYTVHVL